MVSNMYDNYKQGDFITISNGHAKSTFEILGVDNSLLRLRDSFSLIESTRPRVELNELILAGIANIETKNIDEREIGDSLSRSFSDYTEKNKTEAKRRYQYVLAVIESIPKAYSDRILQPVIDSVAVENSDTPPSCRTLKRWLKAYANAGNSIRGLLPAHENKGNYEAKIDNEIEPYIQLAIDHFKNKTCPTVSSSYDYMEALIENDNGMRSPQNKLAVPSIPTLASRIQEVAPKALLESRKGKRIANVQFKQSKNVRDVKLILQRAEIDHTQLDLFVVDDQTNMVLGRPWVTALLDYKSKNILGFYIGFENPSYLSVAKALKHAMSSKSYVKELYPKIENEWLCAGKPAVIATDRGKEFRSVAFEEACDDLNIIIQHNPAKHPWFKGSVERYFSTLNKELLSDKPGKVMTKIYDSIDYRPEKNGVISMSSFMEIFHIWVIDIYQCKPRTRKNIIPKEAWKEDLGRVPIIVESPEKLKLILSEAFTAHLGSTGIIKDYINYDSEELVKHRSMYGFGKVSIKRARDDLGEIYVFDEKTKKYFRVEAVNQKYAKGLSLFQHKIHLKFVKLQLKSKVDIESIARAKVLIMKVVEDEISSSRNTKVTSIQRVARYQNIGMQENGQTKGSLLEYSSPNSGVPKPPKKEIENTENDTLNSEFDGLNNEFDDELEL